MRNKRVPHTGHVPDVAGVPAAVKVGWGFSIGRFCLHLTQYAST
jgi:hypothetical protein